MLRRLDSSHIGWSKARGKMLFLLVPIMHVGASCSKSDKTPPASADSSSVAASGRPLKDEDGDEPKNDNDTNEDLTQHFVGTLEHPVTYYESHGSELFNLVNGKPWHGHLRVRKCAGCAPMERTKVIVQAIGNLRSDPIEPISNGRVVGRVINIGPKEDQTLKIAPPSSGKEPVQHYFIITKPATATSATLWVAHLTFGAKGTPDDNIKIEKSEHLYKQCPAHDDDPPHDKSSEGDFRECKQPIIRTLTESPWFSCAGGCCTAPWPP